MSCWASWSKLEKADLAKHAAALVSKLEDSDWPCVRRR